MGTVCQVTQPSTWNRSWSTASEVPVDGSLMFSMAPGSTLMRSPTDGRRRRRPSPSAIVRTAACRGREFEVQAPGLPRGARAHLKRVLVRP